MAFKVLLTEPIVQEVIDYLGEHTEVTVGERGAYNSEEALKEAVGKYDALLSMLSNPVTEKVLKAGSDRLKIVANHAVGYNNIDIEAAEALGISVANTPDVLTESTADCTLALMLAVARKICEAQSYLREGHFDGWEPLGFLGMELNGRTLGILGMGRIGQAVARRAKAFGMNILYHNRTPLDRKSEKELSANYAENVGELARNSDILSLNCPLTEETYHSINASILQVMPDHSILINTARGPVVDEQALAEALHQGVIAGAGLDVFEEEPKVHPKLLSAPRCVLTPHIASATDETRKAIGMLAANAILGIKNGRTEIPNLIQP